MDASGGSVDARVTSTDAGGVSTLPSVYSTAMPPVVDTPAPVTQPPPSAGAIVDVEFLRSVDGILKAVEIVRAPNC